MAAADDSVSRGKLLKDDSGGGEAPVCPKCGYQKEYLAEQCPKCHLVFRKFRGGVSGSAPVEKSVPRRCVKCDAIIGREARVCPFCKSANPVSESREKPGGFSPGEFLRENVKLALGLVVVLGICGFYYSDKYGSPNARASDEIVDANAAASRKVREIFFKPETVVISDAKSIIENQGYGDYLLATAVTAESTEGEKKDIMVVSRMKRTDEGWRLESFAGLSDNPAGLVDTSKVST